MKRFMRIKIILIGGLLFSMIITLGSCNRSHENSSGDVIIEGKIDPKTVREGIIYFYRNQDSLKLLFAEKTMTDSIVIDKDGNFKLTLKNWAKPGFFDLGTKDMVFASNYFLSPGEHLKLNYKGDELPPELIVSKEDIGKYNYFLRAFNDTFYHSPEVKKFYYIASNFMFAPDYAEYVNKRRLEQIDFFKKYFKNETIDSTFKFYFESEIDYTWANDKLYFLWKKRIRKEVKPIDTNYFDFMRVVRYNDPALLISPNYTRFVMLYIREIYQQRNFNDIQDFSASVERINIAREKFTGLELKIALYNILRDEITAFDKETRNRQTDPVIRRVVDMAIAATHDSSYFHYTYSNP